MKYITLLTDFGLGDGYAGVMKGVIWSICPDAQIADLTHNVTHQNIMEGALTLARCVPYFPAGTVHIAVVDPGVGTARRPIAARLGSHYFVGPDNGLVSVLLEQARGWGEAPEIVHLDKPQYFLDSVSGVFHGRDIFAPVGAHLANGMVLTNLGTPLFNPILIKIPTPHKEGNVWHGEVLHIDSFGNVATNIMREQFPGDQQKATVEIGGRVIEGLVQAFGDRPPGELVALFDSSGYLAVAVVNGNAAHLLQTLVGTPVKVVL